MLGSTRGYKSRNKIEVVIEAKTTTGTTKQTTTESLPTTLGSTTTEGTTATFTTTTTEDTKVLPEEDHSDTEQEEESQHRNHTDLEDLDTDEVVTALPVSDMEAAPSQASAGLIAGVIVCLAAMGLVMAGLGVKHYRRRKSQRAIISYLQAVSILIHNNAYSFIYRQTRPSYCSWPSLFATFIGLVNGIIVPLS